MTTQANNKSKSNSFKISEQVKSILHNRGLSKVFNYQDYTHFKELCKYAFNKAQAIADKFIEEHQTESDFKDYQF